MRLDVHIDWLNGTVSRARIRDVQDFLRVFLGEWRDRDWGVHSYKNSAETEAGAIAAWSDGRAEAFISLNACSLAQIPADRHWWLLATLVSDFGFKGTRVDCAVDDLDRVVPLEQVHEAAERGAYTGFRLTDSHKPKSLGTIVGDSRTFGRGGKAGSGKYLIVYDKALESDGKLDCIRWELRFYKEAADLVCQALAECDDDVEFRRKVGRCLGGAIDFREPCDDREVDRHSDRRPRLPWWATFVAALGETVYRVPRVTPPLQRFLEHIGRTGLRGLATAKVVADSMGVDLLLVLAEALELVECQIDWRKTGARDLGIDLREAWIDGLRSGGVPGR